jgi:LPXTG-motif cell wall-anchored protein
MKKIIGIILAMLMMFSMSTMAFADFVEDIPTTTVVTTKAPAEEKLSIKVKATIDPVAEIEAEEGALVTYKGRKCTFTIDVTNNTSSSISGAIINDFAPTFTDKKTGEELTIYSVKGDGFVGEKTPAETGIDKGDTKRFTYIVYIATADKVNVAVTCLGVTKTIEVTKDPVTLNFVWKDEETTAPTETTTSTTAAPVETTTEATTTTTTAPTYVEDTEETGGDDYVEAPVEDDIPNTGSAPAIGAIAALGLAAGALILLKKKNK